MDFKYLKYLFYNQGSDPKLKDSLFLSLPYGSGSDFLRWLSKFRSFLLHSLLITYRRYMYINLLKKKGGSQILYRILIRHSVVRICGSLSRSGSVQKRYGSGALSITTNQQRFQSRLAYSVFALLPSMYSLIEARGLILSSCMKQREQAIKNIQFEELKLFRRRF